MKYIKSSEIINEVKNNLSSWFDSNKLDESILYRRIRYCLSKIRYENHPYKNTTLVIENYSTDLPEDLLSLNLALLCYQTTEEHPLSRYDKIQVSTTVKEAIDWGNADLETVYQNIHNIDGYIEKIVVSNPEFEDITYNGFVPLYLSNSSTQCTKACLLQQGSTQGQAHIKDGVLYTQVETGLVYIEYYSKLEDNFNYLIPDNERVIDWIISDLIYECFKYLYYNGETDILQRMQLAKQENNTKFIDAMNIIKMNEVSEYYALSNRLTARYAKTANNIWNEDLYINRRNE